MVTVFGFYGRALRLPDVVSVSGYLLDGVIGKQELLAGAPEHLVGPRVGSKRGAFAPGKGADISPGQALEHTPGARHLPVQRGGRHIWGELGGSGRVVVCEATT